MHTCEDLIWDQEAYLPFHAQPLDIICVQKSVHGCVINEQAATQYS